MADVAREKGVMTRVDFFTKDLARELAAADHVVLTEVYAAREEPMSGIDSGLIEGALRSRGYVFVDYLLQMEGLIPHLTELCLPGDLVLVMGAGDIAGAAEDLLAALAGKSLAEVKS